jgi:Na+/H+ antiporter
VSNRDFLVALIAASVIVVGRSLSRRLGLPHPIFLVVLGAVFSVIPDVPTIRLDPNVVFLVILPPLVYRAGTVTSPRELRDNSMPIALSALGLVLVTAFAVAGLAQLAVTDLGWAAAVVLGACVAPTDPVSATSILARMGAPGRIVTILEGEGLVNDGIALTLFGVGISALTAPTGAASALLDFVKVTVGGAAFGLAVGYVMARVRRPWHDARIDVVLSLTIPYLAYEGADALGLSGILSAVVAGIYIGQAAVSGWEPAVRIQAETFWDTATFILEAWLFVLLGLQFRSVVAQTASYPTAEVVGVAVATVGAVVVIRMVWQLLIPSLRWRPEGRLIDTGPLSRGERIVLGWSGLRGAISLAAALSIPATVGGHPFPDRSLVLFATFCVVVTTLLVQGTTLSWVIRRTHTEASAAEQRQLSLAYRYSLQAAMGRLAELAETDGIPEDSLELLNRSYEQRLERATAGLEDQAPSGAPSFQDLQRDLIRVRRHALVELHDRGEIGYAAFRTALYDLDLESESNKRR